jgi:nicotinate-nucleotide pyrophosphorylase
MRDAFFFDTATLESWLQEDVGSFDLTSTLLGLGRRVFPGSRAVR